jgi:hypothetical protein
MWLERKQSPDAAPVAANHALLEPLPLNTEQREAIEHALTRPLTVITGPPGTGKSQVVSSLLINAAKLGKRVLFASKNNKAVDVVEARVNNLGPRPILLRLGRGEYQSKLTDYLTALLASRATEEDRYNHDEAEKAFQTTVQQIQRLQESAERVVKLRNEVDTLEQRVEPLRAQLGEDLLLAGRTMDLQPARGHVARLRVAVHRATRNRQEFFTRLLWFLHRAERLKGVTTSANGVRDAIKPLGLTIPANPSADADLGTWEQFLGDLDARIESVAQVADYFQKLANLSGGKGIESIWKSIADEREKLAKESLTLWEYWLRLAPGRLSAEDRRLLGEFAAVIRTNDWQDAKCSLNTSSSFPHWSACCPVGP